MNRDSSVHEPLDMEIERDGTAETCSVQTQSMGWIKDDSMKNNLPTPISGYTWRPARREDALDLYHLYQAHDQADHTHYAESLETVYNDFDTPRINVEEDTMVALSDDGELVATGWVLINNIAEAQRRAFLWGCVHPQHRRRGLGSALFRWQVETGTRRLDTFDDEVEHALRCFSSQYITDRIHLYQREGFEEVRRSYYMDRDLSQPFTLVSVRENVQIIPWDTTRNAEALKVCNTAFRDHWGFEPISTADWDLEYVGNADFCPKSSRMAICDGKIVGIALVHIPMNQSADKRRGWIWELGVLRDYRKQGIAAALLTGVMQTLRDEGMDAASLSVDTQNLTGALRLYESLGFYADQVSISYARVVKAPASVCVG